MNGYPEVSFKDLFNTDIKKSIFLGKLFWDIRRLIIVTCY